MKNVFLGLFVGLAIALGGCASIARKAVLPGSYWQPPANVVPPSATYELVNLNLADGTKIAAQFGRALDKEGKAVAETDQRPTAIFFYGNRMSIAMSQEIFGDLRWMGVNVLIPDYPGYGMNAGKASEAKCYAAADAAYEYVSNRPDLKDGKIFSVGISLGGGVAIDLASRKPVAGLIAVVPFANVRAVGKDSLAWYLRWAVPMIAHYAAFDNVKKIPNVKCPILLIQATDDHITPAKRTDELVAAAKGNLERVIVKAKHDSSWIYGRDAVAAWLSAHRQD